MSSNIIPTIPNPIYSLVMNMYGIKAHRSCFEEKLHQYLEVKANE